MKSLVFHPSERTAPEEVIRALRDLDSTLDLVWVPNAWLAGRVRWAPFRYLKGGRVLRAELGMAEPDPGTIQYAHLAMQGFAAIESYPVNEADSRIENDLRVRLWNLEHRREEAFAERLDESLGGPRERSNKSKVIDGVRSLGRDSWRRAFKRPVYSRPHRVGRYGESTIVQMPQSTTAIRTLNHN